MNAKPKPQFTHCPCGNTFYRKPQTGRIYCDSCASEREQARIDRRNAADRRKRQEAKGL